MQRRFILPVLAASLLLGTENYAGATQPASQEASQSTHTTFEPIIVRAMRMEQNLMEVPLSMSVVDEKTMRRNPQTNISAMLGDIPGITFDDTIGIGGTRKRVSIRGLDPKNLVILIDGVRQKTIGGSESDRGQIIMSPMDIERIEVIKGPASVLYGSDAIAGVINIITKRGGPKPIGYSASMSYDSSNDGIEPRAAIFGTSNGFTYRFSGTALENNDRRMFDNNRLRNTSASTRNFRLQSGYEWDKGFVSFTAESYKAELEKPFTHTDHKNRIHPTNEVTLFTQGGKYTKADRQAYTGQMEINDISTILESARLTGYWQELDTHFKQLQGLRGNRDWEETTPSHGVSVQTDWHPWEQHKIIFGADYDHISLTGKQWMRRPNGTTQNTESRKGEQETFAVFLQDAWAIRPDLELTVGGRQTWTTTNLKKDLTAQTGKITDDHAVFSAGLVYSGFNDIALRASFSQGYSNPNLNELYGRQTRRGDRNLKPEKSNNYEIGARYNDGKLNIDTSLFYATFTDSINWVSIPPTGLYLAQYQNFPDAKLWGTELAASYTIPDWQLTPYTNLMLKRYQREDAYKNKTFDTGTPLASGKVGVKWEKDFFETDTLFMDLGVAFASPSKRMGYDNRRQPIYNNPKENGTKTDFTIGYEGGSEYKYNMALSVRNIFDQKFEAAGYGGTGRHVMLTVGIEW